jgi:hypothetical protein
MMSMINSDRELVKLAARAAGIDSLSNDGVTFARKIGGAVIMDQWNPLENTDDALELAGFAQLTISFGNGSVCIGSGTYTLVEDTSKGFAEVTRRAIVRATIESDKARAEARQKGIMSGL